MKRKLLTLLCCVMLSALCVFTLTACGDNSGDNNEDLGHTHTYSSKWSYDDTHHFKKATCEHSTEVIDKQAHTMNGRYCTICDFFDAIDSVGLDYELNEDGLGYTVIGIGDCTDSDVIIPNIYDELPVTRIGKGAFFRSSLNSVVIGDNVTHIEDEAFASCYFLQRVALSNTLISIGDGAFASCYGVTSIKIPNSVTSIGENAFIGCGKLIEVYNKSSLEIVAGADSYGGVARFALNVYTNEGDSKLTVECGEYIIFNNGEEKLLISYVGNGTNITLPNDVTKIHDLAFFYCTSLTSVTIGNSVTSIGYGSFYVCTSLVSVTIGNGVTSIGSYAFNNCSSLTSITIPNSVTSIGSYAFQDCTSLTSIEIPNSVTSIGENSFYNCDSLTSIEIPNSVTSIGSYAFRGCSNLQYNIKDGLKYLGNSQNPYLYLADTVSESITTATIESGCRFIGEYTFEDCTSLTNVTIGNSVTSIGSSAFGDCFSLASIEIPNSVTSIGYRAFYNCDSLTSIEIPNSVTSIGDDAFYSCSSLTIYCEVKSKPNGWDSDWNYSNCPVYWYSESEPTTSGNYWHYVDGVVTKW